MNKLFFSAGLLLLLATEPAIRLRDFKPAFGNWKGSLTYLDYSSGKPYTMPANVTINANPENQRQVILAFEYPKEPGANGNDTLVISSDGKLLNGEAVVSRKKSNGVIEIITERTGQDGNENKKALIRHVYSISKKLFSNRKEVRFEGEEKWILRNEYKMSR